MTKALTFKEASSKFTHKELVEVAAKYLEKRAKVVITEMTTSFCKEQPDAIGFTARTSVLIEVKASRSDFLKDKTKGWKATQYKGMGARRYYLAPTGLILPDELPKGWGLITVSDKGRPTLREASDVFRRSFAAENALLLSGIRRIGQNPPTGVSIKAYSYQTACRATLGVRKARVQTLACGKEVMFDCPIAPAAAGIHPNDSDPDFEAEPCPLPLAE